MLDDPLCTFLHLGISLLPGSNGQVCCFRYLDICARVSSEECINVYEKLGAVLLRDGGELRILLFILQGALELVLRDVHIESCTLLLNSLCHAMGGRW